MDIRAPIIVVSTVELVCVRALDVASIDPPSGYVPTIQPYGIASTTVRNLTGQDIVQPRDVPPQNLYLPLVRLGWRCRDVDVELLGAE